MRSVARWELIRCRRLRSASLWLRPRSFRSAGAGAGVDRSPSPSVATMSPPPRPPAAQETERTNELGLGWRNA